MKPDSELAEVGKFFAYLLERLGPAVSVFGFPSEKTSLRRAVIRVMKMKLADPFKARFRDVGEEVGDSTWRSEREGSEIVE